MNLDSAPAACVRPAGAREQFTVLDLDYRPMLWATRAQATEEVQKILGQDIVAVGNREECEVAVGETEPERAADAIVASRRECSTAMPTETEIDTLIAGGDPTEGLAHSLARHFDGATR